MALWVPCRYIYLEDGSYEVLGMGIIKKNPATVTSFNPSHTPQSPGSTTTAEFSFWMPGMTSSSGSSGWVERFYKVSLSLPKSGFVHGLYMLV